MTGGKGGAGGEDARRPVGRGMTWGRDERREGSMERRDEGENGGCVVTYIVERTRKRRAKRRTLGTSVAV